MGTVKKKQIIRFIIFCIAFYFIVSIGLLTYISVFDKNWLSPKADYYSLYFGAGEFSFEADPFDSDFDYQLRYSSDSTYIIKISENTVPVNIYILDNDDGLIFRNSSNKYVDRDGNLVTEEYYKQRSEKVGTITNGELTYSMPDSIEHFFYIIFENDNDETASGKVKAKYAEIGQEVNKAFVFLCFAGVGLLFFPILVQIFAYGISFELRRSKKKKR